MAIGNPITLTNNVASKIISVTATADQTLFTVTGGYRINQLAVFRNGVRLVNGADFTANDGATVTLLTAANNNDSLEFQVFDTFRVDEAIHANEASQTINGNLTLTGDLTATTLSGAFSGNATGLTGTPSITVGNVVGAAATFTGNISVGGTSPQANLDIAPASSSATLRVHARTDSSPVPAIELVRGATSSFGTDTRQDFRLKNSAGELIVEYGQSGTTTEALRVNSTGNVSIGNATAPDKLNVGSTSNGFTAIRVLTSNTGNGEVRFGDSDSGNAGYIRYAHNGNHLIFARDGVEAMRLTSGGRLLLGTTTSRTDFFSGSLDADIQVEGSSYAAYSCYATNGNGAFIFGRDNGVSGSTIGNLSWQADDGTDEVEAARISAQIDGTPGSNDMPGRLVFSTTADGASSPTEGMRLDSSRRLLIGTTSAPAGTDAQYSKLAVRGNTLNSNACYLSLGNNKSTTNTTSNDNLGIITFNDNDSDAGEYARITGASDGANGTNDYPGKLIFATTSDGASSPSERMRITSAGHVDIGANSGSSSGQGFYLQRDGGGYIFTQSALDAINIYQSGTKNVEISSSGSASFAGSVTLGSMSSRAANGYTALIDNTQASTAACFSANNSNADGINFLGIGPGNAITSKINNDGSATFAGNVGLGTAAPSVLLHIAANEPQFFIQDSNSTGNSVNATIQFRDSSNTQLSYLGFASASDSHFSLFNTMSGGDLRFGTASTERLRIASAGQIGLGGANYGTSGQVITSNGSGSAPTWQDAGGGAWNLITTVTASNTATADVTGTSSTYSKYCIIARGVYNQSSTGYVNARMIDNGSAVSSTDYYNSWNVRPHSGTSYGGQSGTNETYFRVARCGDISREYADIYLYFNNPLSSQGSIQMNIVQGHSYGWDGSIAWAIGFNSALYQTGMTKLDGIRFYSDSGNLNGTFQLYGIS